jgi:hypothetical protein
MVAEVQRKYPAVKGAAAGELPWDIEFGFEKGALRLFQIRPLVRYQEVAVLQQLTRLEGKRGTGAVNRHGGGAVKPAVALLLPRAYSATAGWLERTVSAGRRVRALQRRQISRVKLPPARCLLAG